MNIFASIKSVFSSFVTWWEGTTIGQAIDADGAAAKAELLQVGEADLENVVRTIGVAVLGGLATGGEAGAIAAGIAAAPAAFKAAEADISSKTTMTLVTTIVNQMSASATATPNAATASPAPATAAPATA